MPLRSPWYNPPVFSPGRAKTLDLAAIMVSVAVFLGQVWYSSAEKTPVGDAPVHYRYGEIILGAPFEQGEIPVWDGTMPVTALNVIAGKSARRPSPDSSFVQSRAQVLPNIVLGAMLIIGIWWWARVFLGPSVAAAAALIGALEPNVIGHSRFLTTDIPSAAGFFLGLAAITWFCRRPSRTSLIGSGILVGLAQLTKVTNLMLLPLGAAALVAVCLHEKKDLRRTAKLLAVWLLVNLGMAVAIVNIAYSGISPSVESAIREPSFLKLVKGYVPKRGESISLALPLGYAATIGAARWHNEQGHPAYLLGRHSSHGWRYYFPIAIVVKTPLPLLALAFVGAGAAIKKRHLWLLVLCGCSFVYLLVFVLLANVNIGVRHVLPVFPALILLAAFGAAWLIERRSFLTAARLGLFVLMAWLVREAYIIAPHYEEYFNQLAGGPCNGWRVLGDSNVQWGQDGVFVRNWIAKQTEQVSVNPTQPVKGLVVVRADFLAGHTPDMAAAFAWLRNNNRPIGCITPGVLIFRVD